MCSTRLTASGLFYYLFIYLFSFFESVLYYVDCVEWNLFVYNIETLNFSGAEGHLRGCSDVMVSSPDSTVFSLV